MKKTIQKSVDPVVYNESYYKTSNYADYLERSDRYKKTAKEIAELLENLSLIDKNSLILDLGASIGLLLEGFKEQGYSNVLGFEVSEWAIQKGIERNNKIVKFNPEIQYIEPYSKHVLIALDVLEHMTDDEILSSLSYLDAKCLIVRIPNSTDGKTFHLEVSRLDPTHINCKLQHEWINFFRHLGYVTCLKLNLFTLYNSPGVAVFLLLK